MSKIYVDEIHPKTAGGIIENTINCLAQVSTSTSPSDGSVILWNIVSINRGNVYNSSTGRFTAPITGVYEIGYSLTCDPTVDDFFVRIYKNGSGLTNAGAIYNQLDNNYMQVSQHVYIELNSGDYLTIVKQDGAIYTNDDFSSAYFRYIGA